MLIQSPTTPRLANSTHEFAKYGIQLPKRCGEVVAVRDALIAAVGEDVNADMRPAFDQAAATLTEFVDAYGIEPAKGVARTTNGAAAILRRDQAIGVLDDVRRLRAYIFESGYDAGTRESASWYVSSVASATALNAPIKWARLAAHPALGRLALNTRAEAEAVARAAHTTDADRAAAAQAARIEAHAAANARTTRAAEAWAALAATAGE